MPKLVIPKDISRSKFESKLEKIEVLSFSCSWLTGEFHLTEPTDTLCKADEVLSFMIRKKPTHELRHGTRASTWICTICGYKSKHRHVCTEHMYSRHAEPEHLPCDVCGKVYTKKPAYRLHMIKEHKIHKQLL